MLVLALAWPGLAQPAPTVISVDPQPGAVVLELIFINVNFNVAVMGVNASSLLIDGSPATDVVTNDNNNYTFHFPQPPPGPVQVAWAANQGITDTTPQSNPFAGGSWAYTLDTNINTQVSISEFLANNNTGIRDEDGNHSGWIELHNAGTTQASLDGWFLTINPGNLTMWQFPVGTPQLQANSYMIVWASAKNRTDPVGPLHTNFKLSKLAGGYLALVDPFTNVFSEFSAYPAQQADISYGRDAIDPSRVGYFSTPTPGKKNSTTGSGFVLDPMFSVDSGIYTNDSLTLTISASNAPPGSTIRYTMKPNTSTAISVPDTNSLVYTGAITFSTNLLIKVRVFPPGNTNLFPSQIICKNYLFLDGTDQNFNSELPLLIISTQGQSIPASVPPGAIRAEGTLAIMNLVNGRSSLHSTPEYIGPAGFETYGQTSVGFSKPPVRIETHDSSGNQLNVPLLGLPADNDWKLRNPFDDKTLLNDYLGYELFEKMGRYSCRRRFVEVFINAPGAGGSAWSDPNKTGRLKYPDDYVGVEVLFETIKTGAERVNIPSITPYDTTEPAITGGWIIKKDKDSTGDLNFSTAGGNGFPGEALKIHEPRPNTFRTTPGNTTSWPGPGYTPSGSNQLSYIVRYLNQMEKSLYATNWLATNVVGTTNHWSYYLDADSWVDFHWVVEFSKQIDGIRLSDYFTKDRLGKVMPGPIWDWNLSFGNANYLRGGQTDGWYYAEQDQGITANEHIWLRRLINGAAAMGAGNTPGPGGDPDFNQKVADRWSVLRTNVLNGTNVLHRIDELSAMLNEAAQRDLWGKWKGQIVGVYQWPNPDGTADGRDVDYVHPTNYLGEASNSIIGQMKKWMLGRYLWIDSQFTPIPTFSSTDGQVTNGFSITITPPTGATLYYTLDGTDPRVPGGGVLPTAVTASGPATLVINSNVRIVARAKKAGNWYNTWSGPAAVSLFIDLPPLRITEIMYHPLPPPPGSTNKAGDFEYIEVQNIGNLPLNVNGFSLGGGVQFQFPNLMLGGGQSAVIVANLIAFQSRYGSNILVLGAFTGNLNNAGDHLVLTGPLDEPILDFSYDNKWYPATDGLGFSLVTFDIYASTGAWNSAGNWRPSSGLGGSPGQDDPPPPPRPQVVINEALTNEDPPAGDAIEIYNNASSPADVSGWFLTDSFKNPRKFVIPPNSILPPGGFMVFYATNSFGVNGTNSFGLGAKGEQVYLFSGDGVDLTGYAQGFDFGAAANGVTFGRYVISTGADHFVAQVTDTLGEANAGPVIGPIVISEINYHPPDIAVNGIGFNDTVDEYIELQNITPDAVHLYDPDYPTNTWKLQTAIDYQFPSGVLVPAGGFLLLVGFDPAADAAATASFRSRNFVPDTVPLFGPWQQALGNGGASIELFRPGTPDPTNSATPGAVPYILVERIQYSDTAPWPSGADGFGLTLQRIVPSSYGNDPTNWVAVAPTPGGTYVAGGTPPAITSQPGSVLVPTSTDLLLSVSATGTAPLRYQWRFNGLNLSAANDSTLVLSNLQFSQAGVYNVLVYNSAGSALSSNFTVSARVGLKIITQSTNRLAQLGQTTNFTLFVVGTGALRYQWRFNGGSILNATNATITITNVQLANQGSYDCVVRDDIDITTSQPASLTVIYRPHFTFQPLSQSAWVGGTISLSAAATGTTPINFRWRRVGQTLINGSFSGFITSGPTNSTLTLTNLQVSDSANYTVVVTNIAGFASGGPQLGLSITAVLTVLADSDGDGMPDYWETLYGLNPNDPSDATADSDGDGMTNLQEYLAGTNPTNALSYLKIDRLNSGLGPNSIQFSAVSNKTYSVQYKESLTAGRWMKLADVISRPSNRVETVLDPFPAADSRLYRLATPQLPDPTNGGPAILTSPLSVRAAVGDNAGFSVFAVGTGLPSYQWQFNGNDISGATNSNLPRNNVQLADAGNYAVVVSDQRGSQTSGAAVLALRPLIAVQPQGESVVAGSDAVLSVGASGTGPLAYRWLHNSIALSGQTNSVLTLSKVQAADAGNYAVRVTVQTPLGILGTLSSNATLTVRPP